MLLQPLLLLQWRQLTTAHVGHRPLTAICPCIFVLSSCPESLLAIRASCHCNQHACEIVGKSYDASMHIVLPSSSSSKMSPKESLLPSLPLARFFYITSKHIMSFFQEEQAHLLAKTCQLVEPTETHTPWNCVEFTYEGTNFRKGPDFGRASLHQKYVQCGPGAGVVLAWHWMGTVVDQCALSRLFF